MTRSERRNYGVQVVSCVGNERNSKGSRRGRRQSSALQSCAAAEQTKPSQCSWIDTTTLCAAKCLFVLKRGATDENSTSRKAPRARTRDALHLVCLWFFYFFYLCCSFHLPSCLHALKFGCFFCGRGRVSVCWAEFSAGRRRADAKRPTVFQRRREKKPVLSSRLFFFFFFKAKPLQRGDLSGRLWRKNIFLV